MKLTETDRRLSDKPKALMESMDMWVELRLGRPSYVVLKGVYGGNGAPADPSRQL